MSIKKGSKVQRIGQPDRIGTVRETFGLGSTTFARVDWQDGGKASVPLSALELAR